MNGVFALLEQCLALTMRAPVCYPLWENVMVASFVIGIVIVMVIAWRMVSHQRKLAAALQAKADRDRLAREEMMAQYTSRDIGELIEDVTDPHLAEKIRREIAQQKKTRVPAGR